MVRRRPIQQYHCSLCAGLFPQRERLWWSRTASLAGLLLSPASAPWPPRGLGGGGAMLPPSFFSRICCWVFGPRPATRCLAGPAGLSPESFDGHTGNFAGVFLSSPVGRCPAVPYDVVGRIQGPRVVFQTSRNWTSDCRVTTVGSGRFVSPTTVVTRWIARYVGPDGRMVRVRGTDVFQRI